MTNWPNIQEYRNFEVKFIDDPKSRVSLDSAENSDLETVIKDEYTTENISENNPNGEKFQSAESKIVRCVIRKDFEETFKKADGVHVGHENARSKLQEPAPVDRSLDKIRLQNHLKWKKQKEQEYLLKKEAEKVAQQKKKEEELRLEKVRKEKEKERLEKLKMWQDQKTREKEEKKKEKLVIKMLEEEFKVPPMVDKEKLIEEWVKLKDKQKQIEAEKKAEQQKKEEESRALRQTLAKLSYRQWKERVKGRMMALPKNGYQIFGPKPVPVVKEDWNHDFTRSSPRSETYSLRHTRSCSTTLSLSPALKELDDFSGDLFYLGDLKSRSPSFYQMDKMKNGLNLPGKNPGQCEMPLKELQPGTVALKKKGANKLKNGFEKTKAPMDLNTRSEVSFFSKYSSASNHPENRLNDFMCFTGAQGDQNRYIVSSQKKALDLLNVYPKPQLLPNKKKLDLYINTSTDDNKESYDLNYEFKPEEKQSTVSNKQGKIHSKDGKGEKAGKKVLNQTVKNISKETLRPQNRARSLSLQKFEKNTNLRSVAKKETEQETAKAKSFRRSQSCDKSLKKVTISEKRMKNCSSSKSMVKVTTATQDDRRKNSTKSRTTSTPKRRSRKVIPSEVIPSKSEKKLLEMDNKNKKKLKRKNSLSKSFSFIDSPYCAKISSKSLSKLKLGRRKSTKDVEIKSDGGGLCRRLSGTKI